MTSWLFLFSPLPVSLFWPGLLLPAVLVAFLAEGSKFLMFDTAVCRTALWTPTGVDSLAQRAETCDLGTTAVHTIVSGCIFFIALMFVCLKAPEKRDLDVHYGLKYDNKDPMDGSADVESQLSGVNDYESQGSYPRGSDVYIVAESVSHTDRSVDYESVGGRSGRSGHSGSRRGRSSGLRRGRSDLKIGRSETSSVHSEAFSYGRDGRRASRHGRDGRESKSAARFPDDCSRDDVAESVDLSKQQSHLVSHGDSMDASFDDRMTAAEIAIRRSEQQRISESRVSKIEKMELSSASQSEDLIEKFVSDLNLSFQQDEMEGESGPVELPSVLNLGKAVQA